MGVDGIGPRRSVGPGAIAESAEPSAAAAADAATAAARPQAAGEVSAVGATAELGQLQRGEIGVEQYLDAQVERAVAHLRPQLDPQQLDLIRATLREQLATDPLLTALVRRATRSAQGAEGR